MVDSVKKQETLAEKKRLTRRDFGKDAPRPRRRRHPSDSHGSCGPKTGS